MLRAVCAGLPTFMRTFSCGSDNVYRNGDIVVDYVLDEEGKVNVFATKKTAAMQCPCCGHKVSDETVNRFALSAPGRYVVTKDADDKSRVSYRFPRSAIPWVTWGDVWERFHKANELRKQGVYEPFVEYRQKQEAGFWEKETVIERAVIKHDGVSVEQYADGEKVDGEVHRFMSLDRGLAHYWYVVAAFDSNGQMHVLRAGKAESESEVKEISTRYGIPKGSVVCDVSWEMAESVMICIRNEWVGIRGEKQKFFQHFDRRGKVTSKLFSKLKRYSTEIGVGIYFDVCVHEYKNKLTNFREVGRVIIPHDITPLLEKHINGEVLTEDTVAKTGEKKYYWKRLKANHLFDCLVYSLAVADAVGCLGASTVDTEEESS